MKVVVVKDKKDIKLESCINRLRDVLNEICTDEDKDKSGYDEGLIVSKRLDEFIVEYMKQSTANPQKPDEKK